MIQYIALFDSSRQVIKAESVAIEAAIETRIIPVPEKISSECGMCIVIHEADLDKFKELMQQKHIKTEIYVR